MPCRALLFKAENSSSDSENEMVFDDDSDIDVDMDDYTAEKDEVSVADFILVEFLDKRVEKSALLGKSRKTSVKDMLSPFLEEIPLKEICFSESG